MLRKTVRSLINVGGRVMSRAAKARNALPRSYGSLRAENARLREALSKYEDRQIFYLTTEDYHAHDKMRQAVAGIETFGEADFASLSSWLFAASLNNHRVVHQRIDEGSLLWRAVKMSGGPILEVGRAAGGSTIILLGASGARPVVSIDRAPFHAFIAEDVFRRPDVESRLKLYVQTSREPIAETEFGMVFIDADHSYEGICHDIGMFWNQLRSFDGKPPLAAFHDGADNPITFVEPVKTACDELLAEPGVARVVQSWGSMLVLEKTGDIDPNKWFTKEHFAFWEQFATPQYPVLRPTVLDGRLRSGAPAIRTAPINLLGDENVEHESWVKKGVTVGRLQLNEDSPVRLVRETTGAGEHGIEKTVALNAAQFKAAFYLRPHRGDTVRFAILDADRKPLAQVDFNLGTKAHIAGSDAATGVELIDAGFAYRNGYYCCDLAIRLPQPPGRVTFAVTLLPGAGAPAAYQGDGERGFFANLSSIREIV